jgi:hypothetical protein
VGVTGPSRFLIVPRPAAIVNPEFLGNSGKNSLSLALVIMVFSVEHRRILGLLPAFSRRCPVF